MSAMEPVCADVWSFTFLSLAEMYRAHALPSAGLFPFLQTVLCDVGQGPFEDARDMPDYPDAG